MSSGWRIFSLEVLGLLRGKTFALLMLAVNAWVLLAPQLVRGDGTAEGAEELMLKYALGGAAAILSLTMLITGAGSLARERETHRLQLTLVRPAGSFTVVAGRILALGAVFSFVLAVAFLVYLVAVPHATLAAGGCSHVLRPAMPSPREEAAAVYDAFINEPETPPEIRRAPKAVVLRLLAQRAIDRYQVVAAGETESWRFKLPADPESVAVRLRFANLYDQRRRIAGRLTLGQAAAPVDNITQAVCVFDLAGNPGGDTLAFANTGKESVLLRPRKDIELLVPAGGFGANLLRAWVELAALLMLLAAFSVTLSAFLGRPVAVFVAVVALVLAEMSPSVIEQYPDELERDRIDAVGLFLSRLAMEATHPASAVNPVEKLAEKECVEWREAIKFVALDAMLLPLILTLFAAYSLPRKQ